MKNKLQEGYVSSIISKLESAGETLKTAMAELESAEADLKSIQERAKEEKESESPSQTSEDSAEATAQERVDKAKSAVEQAKQKLTAAKQKAQELLNEIEKSINANKQDEQLLSSARSETGVAEPHFQQARQSIRADISKLQNWQRQLKQALKAAEGIGEPERNSYSGGYFFPYDRLYTPLPFMRPTLDERLRYIPQLSQSYAIGPPRGAWQNANYQMQGTGGISANLPGTEKYILKDHYGSKSGSIDNFGNLKDSTGSIEGKLDMLDPAGTRIIDNAGSTIGRIDHKDGQIKNELGQNLSRVESTAPLGARMTGKLDNVVGGINNYSIGGGYGQGTYRL